MPEGDAIFRTARTLHRALAGRTVERFDAVLPHLARVDEDAPLAGRMVERVRAAGKHLLIEFSGGLVLRTHMRMNGSWHVYGAGERWRRPFSQMRLAIRTDAYTAVAFNVPVAEFRTTAALDRTPALRALGPDLLAEAFDIEAALARFQRAGEAALADALLDQRLASGIGNVYKSEVCFLCRVHPFTPVSRVEAGRLRELLSTARRLLQANVHEGASGRIVTRRTLRSAAGRASPNEERWVYGRAGRPCYRCGVAIAIERRGEDARSTYWCPACQISS